MSGTDAWYDATSFRCRGVCGAAHFLGDIRHFHRVRCDQDPGIVSGTETGYEATKTVLKKGTVRARREWCQQDGTESGYGASKTDGTETEYGTVLKETRVWCYQDGTERGYGATERGYGAPKTVLKEGVVLPRQY
eukprot:3941349-Rhodomonas_salina.1